MRISLHNPVEGCLCGYPVYTNRISRMAFQRPAQLPRHLWWYYGRALEWGTVQWYVLWQINHKGLWVLDTSCCLMAISASNPEVNRPMPGHLLETGVATRALVPMCLPQPSHGPIAGFGVLAVVMPRKLSADME